MKRFVALLRGVNISGKNKVPMWFFPVMKWYNEIGEPKPELEKIKDYKDVIFWSFSRKDYQKTNWWSKTASVNISTKLTIRTANTVRKIVGM